MGASIAAVSFVLFLLFQAQGIGAGDSGDLVTAGATFGVAHPPGYPLFSFLGWILNHLPIATPAWRFGLLSSVSHAVVVGLLWQAIYRFTGRRDSATFGALVLVGNYLFFLYAITPEVFALLDVFLMVLIGLVWLFIETRRTPFFYLACLTLGLALTHHHLILFTIPAIFAALFRAKRGLFARVSGFRAIGFFAAGLVPYLYVPWAARGMSIINWDHADTISNFIRLVTRADYGTFLSGGGIGTYPVHRFLAIKAFVDYLLVDFRFVGIVLFIFGCVWLMRQKTSLKILLPLSFLFLGPFFFFYASFPLSNRFALGTYERFLLPSYLMVVFLIGIGHARFVEFASLHIGKLTPNIPKSMLGAALSVVLFLYPLSMAGVTLWRFWGIRTDTTAEHLAQDILLDVPEGSVVTLSKDTPLFTTQYTRYALNYRPDVYVIHGSFLPSSAYRDTLRKVFPQLTVPTEDKTALSDFLTTNAQTRPVFANVMYPVSGGWYWIPHGLLFQLMNTNLPSIAQTRQKNMQLWERMHHPDDGILSRYNHLMLSDIRDTYTGGRIEFGKFLLRANLPAEAMQQFAAAIEAGGDTELVEAYMYKGISHSFISQCTEALDAFEQARMHGLAENTKLLLFEGFTYRDCVGDPSRAGELFAAYEQTQTHVSQPLEGW